MKAYKSMDRLLHWAHGALYAEEHAAGDAVKNQPFITISRQAGARGRTFARRLAERLNAIEPAEHPWTVWDRELVEKIAAESHFSAELIESIEGHRRRWWEELAANWSEPDEFQVYRRVAAAIRALAKAGRAIIVGRGGVYATSDLPGGIHLRLVAPLASRIAHMAGELKVSPEAAAAEVRRLDRDRDAFHRRYSSGKALLPEVFTITLNTASLTDDQMVSCILPLVRPQLHNAAACQTDTASDRLPVGTEVT